MIRYTLRLFGIPLGSLDVEDDMEVDVTEIGGGSGHNFERSPEDFCEEDFGFR